jgi:hypothetical protein
LPLSQLTQIERVPGVTGVAAYARFGGYYQDPKNQIGAGAVMRMLAGSHARFVTVPLWLLSVTGGGNRRRKLRVYDLVM